MIKKQEIFVNVSTGDCKSNENVYIKTDIYIGPEDLAKIYLEDETESEAQIRSLIIRAHGVFKSVQLSSLGPKFKDVLKYSLQDILDKLENE